MSGFEGLNAVIYARVSTDNQGQDPKKQIAECKQFCQREGIYLVKDGTYEEQKSGKDLDRRQFQAMIGRVVTGTMSGETDPSKPNSKVNLIVAWSQSRISRDTSDFLNIKKQIEKLDCRFLFVDSPSDTTSDDNEVLITIQAAMAQAERKRISKNVKMALRQAKLNGKCIGRPKRFVFMEDMDKYEKGQLCFGDNVKHKTIVLKVEEFMSYADQGYSIGKIAKEINVPRSTLYTEVKKFGRMDEYYTRYNKARGLE